MNHEHPAVGQVRRDLETFLERKRRLQAGEFPGVDAPEGQPPTNFDREREIAQTEAKIVELAGQLKAANADQT